MIDSFVDLTYRGLSLGRRVKLTQVRPSTGYVETPVPMPVGTAIAIATDEGIVFDALVMTVHEQVGGSDRAPGMVVAPAFGEAVERSDQREWWKARVALPEEPPASTRIKPVTVRPRTHTMPEPAIDVAETSIGEVPTMSTTGVHDVVDDGKLTMMMDAVDPAALGLDMGDSGSLPAASDEEEIDDPPKSSPSLPDSVKKRKKKR